MKKTVSCTSVEPEIDSMKDAFINWFNDRFSDFDCPKLSRREVYVVWFCYIVGNAKMLISTTRPDHMYYEVTYHEEKHQLHIDAYKKFTHESIDISTDDEEEEDDTAPLEDMFNNVIGSIWDSLI
jgi:hypothetical protein